MLVKIGRFRLPSPREKRLRGRWGVVKHMDMDFICLRPCCVCIPNPPWGCAPERRVVMIVVLIFNLRPFQVNLEFCNRIV